MRIHSTSAPDDAFGDDCPTVLPSPVEEHSIDEMNRAFDRHFASTSATPTVEKTNQISSKDALSGEDQLTEKQQAVLEKGKAPISGGSSTKTSSTAVFEGEGTDESPYIVDWTENDPENPLRWVRGSLSCFLSASIVVMSNVSFPLSAHCKESEHRWHLGGLNIMRSIQLVCLCWRDTSNA